MLEENDRHLTLDDYEDPTSNLPLTQSDAVMALAAATSDLARAVSKISYVPTVWVDNNEPDINAANLNKIEQGILQATTAIIGAVDAINRNASAIAAINGNLGNGEFISTSILQKALELPAGCYIFRLSGEGYSGNDLPPGSNSYKYGTACIYKRSNTSIIVVLYGEAISSPMVINSYLTKWSGWQTYITNTDFFFALVSGQVSNGGIRYNNEKITLSTVCVASLAYNGGSANYNYSLVVQPGNGFAFIYIKNPDNTAVADGTTVNLHLMFGRP